MKSKSVRLRLTTMVGVACLGVAAMVGSAASAAIAAPESGNVDGDREGSLTIHKFLHQAPGGATGDISNPPAAGDFTDPVAGVEFTVYPLLSGGNPVDLTVYESWAPLNGLTPGAACTAPAGYTLGTPMVMPLTDAAGMSQIALPVTAYMVCETATPANIVDKAPAFILTIPMPVTVAGAAAWEYDVNAYPKNGDASVVKTIEEQDPNGLGLGSVVKFPVTVPIPRMDMGWTGFGLTDTLDPRLDPVAPGDIKVQLDGVDLDPSYYEPVVAGQKISVELNAAGLAWLNTAPGNTQVGKNFTVIFAGTINAAGVDGIIPNTATFFPNNPGFNPDGEPGIPSNEVETHWGNLEIVKRAEGTTGAVGTLEGAKFEIYPAVDPYPASGDCSAAVKTGTAINVGGATEFTTDGTGKIAIGALFVSDTENPVINSPFRCYVLVETAAPAGYVLPTNPDTAVKIEIGQLTTNSVDIENVQRTVPELPLTGAAGQIILISLGMGALAVAGGLVLMRRRRTMMAE